MTTGTEALDSDELELLDDHFAPTRILEEENKRIGRYELVWELGTGGMANVYLARARGPAGFHKWFAIKRIHPHLAKDKRFVDMFLDEARIAAAVHHPNVTQVFDLGDDGGDPYIAMEYLHGEHLGALSVRAVRRQGRVPYGLAARIIASAADGLHHAHDSKDQRGEALNLVHRDVSPQNIFVTYEGTVKLTDFGIAKAENRITHTKTGSMKGKCAYMAPEQALGQAVDRRTDIFALGIVLWEITTGRRLFKAATDAQTLMRITSGRVKLPTAVEPGYPPALERIVMRALSPKPSGRYPTAAAMARDLDRYVASIGQPSGQAEVRGLMTGLFPDRISAKEDLLRSEPGTVADFDLRSSSMGHDSGESGLPAEPSRSEILERSPRDATPRVRAAPKSHATKRPPLVFLIALGLLSVAVAIATFSLFAGGTALVRIDTSPSGAQVSLDGVEQGGTTPLLIEAVGEGRHSLVITLDGFEAMQTTFDAEDSRVDLDYRLRAETEGTPDSDFAPIAETEPDPAEGAPAETETEAEAEAETPGDEAQEEVASATDDLSFTEEEANEAPAEAASPPDTANAPSEEAAPIAARMTRRGTPRGEMARRAVPAELGYLNVITRPWATITVNGQPAGNTPLMRYSVPPGSIVVRLRAEGSGAPRVLRLRVQPGQTVSQSIDLR